MSVLQAVLNLAYLTIVIFALLGAMNSVKDSVVIFKESLRKRSERNDR